MQICSRLCVSRGGAELLMEQIPQAVCWLTLGELRRSSQKERFILIMDGWCTRDLLCCPCEVFPPLCTMWQHIMHVPDRQLSIQPAPKSPTSPIWTQGKFLQLKRVAVPTPNSQQGAWTPRVAEPREVWLCFTEETLLWVLPAALP